MGDAEVELVVRAFAAPSSGAGACAARDAGLRDVNYKWFLAALGDVEGVLASLPPRSAPLPNAYAHAARASAEGGYMGGAPPLARRAPAAIDDGGGDAAVAAVREVCASKRIRIKTFIVDHDPLRKGCVGARGVSLVARGGGGGGDFNAPL